MNDDYNQGSPTDTSSDNETAQNEIQTSEEQTYTSEWLKENTSIRGWLSFFLFIVGLGGVVSAFAPLFTIKPENYANNVFLICADALPGICMLVVAIYTIYAFNTRKPNAVFYGKFYVVLALVTNLLSLFFGDFEQQGLNTLGQAVKNVIWSAIWFMYLVTSKHVQEIIPSSFRKTSLRDWLIVAGVLLVPVFCLLIGYVQVKETIRDRETSEMSLSEVELSDNEWTDGRIIFTVPDSFQCSERGLKVYTITNEAIGNCILCSDYDSDTSRAHFNQCRLNWKDSDTSGYLESDVDEGEKIIAGNKCLYKITSYDINGVKVFWRYFLLFDKETGKVALLSCYDRNENIEYVDALLHSIRFK